MIMGEGKLLFSFPQAPIFSAFSRNREFRCLRAATRGSASGLRDLFEKRSIKNFNDNPIEVSRQTDAPECILRGVLTVQIPAVNTGYFPIAVRRERSSSVVRSRHSPGLSIPSLTGPMLTRRRRATSSPTASHIRRISRFLPS